MTTHIAVMTEEVLSALAPKAGGRYLDGTLGGATHTRALLQASGPDGRVLSMDVDRSALERARTLLSAYGQRWIGVEENFRYLDRVAKDHDMIPLDGILLDLGFSSDELIDPVKGLSFMQDGPLDMRLGFKANEDGLTAAEIVNSWSPSEIERVISTFGEDPFARKIAYGIVEARKAARIIGTLDLVSIIKRSVPMSAQNGIHPATKTFQALRIAVNDELETLKLSIAAAERALSPGGILAIISFHSLEDRIVKQAFQTDAWDPQTKHPLTPSDSELAENPRSRSAKLRFAIKK